VIFSKAAEREAEAAYKVATEKAQELARKETLARITLRRAIPNKMWKRYVRHEQADVRDIETLAEKLEKDRIAVEEALNEEKAAAKDAFVAQRKALREETMRRKNQSEMTEGGRRRRKTTRRRRRTQRR